MKGNKSKLGQTLSPETRAKLSLANKGKKMSEEEKLKRSKALKGRKLSASHRENIAKGKTGKKLVDAYKTSLARRIRASAEYRLWRTAVFTRDAYTCVWCGIVGGPLNADHIKPFAFFPELRFAIDNGRTLCVPCHKTTETYAGRMRKLSTR